EFLSTRRRQEEVGGSPPGGLPSRSLRPCVALFTTRMTSFKLVITLTTMKEKPVSSKHVRVDRTPSSLQLTDLGSTNGTIVNGRKIEANSALELKGGDKVMIGLYQVSVVASEEELSD